MNVHIFYSQPERKINKQNKIVYILTESQGVKEGQKARFLDGDDDADEGGGRGAYT